MKPNAVSTLVIGAAIKVHSPLGAGVLESACDACLYHELKKAGLNFEHPVSFVSSVLSTRWNQLPAMSSSYPPSVKSTPSRPMLRNFA